MVTADGEKLASLNTTRAGAVAKAKSMTAKHGKKVYADPKGARFFPSGGKAR
jgi:hypothetical protein